MLENSIRPRPAFPVLPLAFHRLAFHRLAFHRVGFHREPVEKYLLQVNLQAVHQVVVQLAYLPTDYRLAGLEAHHQVDYRLGELEVHHQVGYRLAGLEARHRVDSPVQSAAVVPVAAVQAVAELSA